MATKIVFSFNNQCFVGVKSQINRYNLQYPFFWQGEMKKKYFLVIILLNC